ncbi:MAG: RloB family protein [Candidatus Cloacimonetes bacterium]|nr:RloB family protein [Candidatus Cloacimonadota bacterium]
MTKLLHRAPPHREIKKCYYISTEGKTERIYLNMIAKKFDVLIKLAKDDNQSAPSKVLLKLRKLIRNEKRAGDEAWILIDRDNWKKEEILQICKEAEKKNIEVAVSNPRFEYWLLLHFDKCKGIKSSSLKTKLERYIPQYDKGDYNTIQLANNVSTAIANAKEKDTPPRKLCLLHHGTTVYRLVERLINNQ